MGAGVRAFREFEADGQVLCAEHSGGAVGVDRPRSSRPSPPNPFAGEPRLCRNALSAAMVRTAGPGSYVDGNGLMLRVKAHGTRQWVQRLTIHGRRVDLGFGSAELVSLADVHRAAADNRAIARTGGDPRRIQVPTFAAAEEACSPRSSRPGGRRVRRATGAWRWTSMCCRSSAACVWTGSARRRCTRCCGRSHWPASTPW